MRKIQALYLEHGRGKPVDQLANGYTEQHRPAYALRIRTGCKTTGVFLSANRCHSEINTRRESRGFPRFRKIATVISKVS